MKSLRTHVATLIANISTQTQTPFSFLLIFPSNSQALHWRQLFVSVKVFHDKKDLKMSRRFFDASTSINWYFIDLENPAQKLIVKIVEIRVFF